jgi:hypothetical protein
MYVLRVTLMYLLPFAGGVGDYVTGRSLPFAAGATVFLLGVVVWRREKAFAMYRRAVKDVEGIIRDAGQETRP